MSKKPWDDPTLSPAELEQISKASNAQLLEAALGDAGGDDYDGCFTAHGTAHYEALVEELNKRLGQWLERPLYSSDTEEGLWKSKN